MRRNRWTALPAALALVVAAGACSAGDGETGVAAPRRAQSALGDQPGTGGCPPLPETATPDVERPSYLMDLTVRLDEGVVDGRLSVRFTPDLATDRLVFRLWPNGPRPASAGARMTAGPVYLGSTVPVPTSSPEPTTLVVPLEDPLEPGEEIEATVPWRLTLPGPADDRLARQGDALRLGSFFPILSWEPGLGWALDPPTATFAEASTSPAADFSYSVSVPDGLSVLATGTPSGGRWKAVGVRDVAISVGRFRTAEGTARAPGPVRVTVGVHEGMGDDPGQYLERVVAALEDFARRFGPYPYPTHTLALTPGLSGGIEYPGHVMQGTGTLASTTAHEVAHLWFYSLVGNDQGRDPWLDEGLATWAEARFEETLAAVAATPVPEAARGRLGAPMTYWESHPADYYRGVYVQGAQALAALGDPGRVDCGLRRYVASQAFGLARPEDLVEALRPVLPEADRTLARFGVLP